MFTVKATYRNETRRFTFPEPVLFPTYNELYHQLYRVFPVCHNYYLSRLVFSPDASKPGRILVGREVHSAEDYDSCIAPLRRRWPNPLLRFIIFDETPHKAPAAAREALSFYSTSTVPFADPKLPSPIVPETCRTLPLNPPSFISPPSFLESSPIPPSPPPPKIYPPPPPPILFSSPPNKYTAANAHCCPITKGKADIESLLSSFKEDIERILRRTFGTSYAEEQCATFVKSPAPNVSDLNISLQTETPAGTSAKASRWCFVCKTSFAGVWYGCVKCPWHAVCPTCFSKSHSAHTLSFGPSHVVQQRSANHSTQVSPEAGKEIQSCGDVPLPRPASLASTGGASLSVHRGVTCDNCNETVVGVRHKCLDCPDYDLCTGCLTSGVMENHDPFHEFFDIEVPGRVYVHTVSNRDKSRVNRQRFPSGSDAAPVNTSVHHSATCNLCDSAIVGERYKCVVCPDFDTCSSCFRITAEQHPRHGFVRVAKPKDLMMRDSVPRRQVAHLAVCDSCQKTIRGVRYKCLHSSCPDFDLCSDCEALPIAVHPLNHPMLKMKTPDSIIPTVYSAGDRQIINEPISQKSAPARDESRSAALRPQSPTTILSDAVPVAVPCQAVNVPAEDQVPSAAAEEYLSPLGSPASDVIGGAFIPAATIAPPHLLIDVAGPPKSPNSTHPILNIYDQLWPRVNHEMVHLNAKQALKSEDSVNPIESTESITPDPVAQLPLTAESLLAGTPVTSAIPQLERCTSPISSSKSPDDGYRTSSPMPSDVQESHRIVEHLPVDNQQVDLTSAAWQNRPSSTLVNAANVPDGQIFPPGAEFVKGWHVVNDGGLPWPATTTLQFVAGEMFAMGSSAALRAKVGVVLPGQDLDIWTGELKVPDNPGRYVGYWRLNDGQGNFFGNNMWIDLTVVDHHSDDASEHSLAASSMVMPSTHSTNSVDASPGLRAPQSSLPSSKTVTDEVEDAESDVFSVSLVSVPTSEEEDAEWQDTRTHSEPMEYVVLYGDRSEE